MKTKHICTLGNNIYVYQHLSVRERFKRLFLISENNPLCKTYFRSLASIDRERTRQMTTKYASLIHPFSMFRMYYEVIFMVIFLCCIWEPMLNTAISVHAKYPDQTLVHVNEFLIDLTFIVDVILTFLSGHVVTRKKEVVLDSKQVASIYLKSFNFYLDIYCFLPLGLLLRFFVKLFPKCLPYYRYIQLINYTQIIRIRKFFHYYDHVSKFKSHLYFMKVWIKHILKTSFILHWLTCLYINFTYLSTSVVESNVQSLTFQYVPPTFLSRATIYCHSLFIVCANILGISLVTGYSQPVFVNLENVYTKIIFLFYALLGFFAGNLFLVTTVQLLHSNNSSRTKYHAIKSEVLKYMTCKDLNTSMRRRILTYYEYKFRSKYFRESTILNMLSETLRRDIYLHSCRTLIENVSILKELPADIISEVVSCLKHEVFLYNDIIFKAGSLGDCMYFIGNGTVAISTSTGKEICHLQDGAHFGEIALVAEDQKRVANVVAIEICELYRLDRRNFKACFPQNSVFLKKIVQVAKERLEKTVLLEELHKKYIIEKNVIH